MDITKHRMAFLPRIGEAEHGERSKAAEKLELNFQTMMTYLLDVARE